MDLIPGRLVGAALVHRDLLGNAVGLHGFVKKAQGCGLVTPGRQQKVNRLAFFIHSTVEIFAGAFDFDVTFVHAPVAANRALVLAKHLSSKGRNRIAQRLIEE